jgi:hypothetical protein
MWHIINKIVSMIYPQWSKGVPSRKIYQEELGFKYNIPFTQLPSNTPMVRLRLGDLFTSNYNKKSIAGVFGFTKKELSSTEPLDIYNSSKKDNLQKFLLKKDSFTQEEFDLGIKSLNIRIEDIKTKLKENNVDFILKEDETISIDKYSNSSSIIRLVDLYNSYIRLINDNKEYPIGNDPRINNPITYAYETTMGKGLAGHITSLGIDWDQDTPWDVIEGNRAPMFVKISIGFSPVHDIPLGLDHNGMMRAVPYMVGNKVSSIYNDDYFDFDEDEFKK